MDRNGKKCASVLCGTPLGPVRVTEDRDGICSLRFVDGEAPGPEPPEGRYLSDAARQLQEYFSGARRAFDLPLSLQGGTPCQLRVWEALRRIPPGQTRSYQEIARAVGSERAARAVGMACNRNPIWILIPCHRVVGKNGGLTGYAGGLDRKRRLLELERSFPD